MNLALCGGTPAFDKENEELFHWPIVIDEDIEAVTTVLKSGTMSGTAITKQFEKKFAAYLQATYALGFCNGTASLLAAMWACKVGIGDEIICPSMTYWASAAPALLLGATVNFCDINRNTLCIDPLDIEHRICEKTKAIVVVHYAGHPAPMKEIMAIARKYRIRVIEDNSHAHGALYYGNYTGTLADIAAMSLMAGKGFAIGEAGIITTNDRELYERCIAFAHYERTGVVSRFNPSDDQITDPLLKKFSGIPLGAMKGRMNQTCSAMGLVQLKYFPKRIQEIQDAINYFWDCMKDTPGVKPHRIAPEQGTMGCWYYPQGLYYAEELGGTSAEEFSKAINAEGIRWCFPGGNDPLHLHPYFFESDIFRCGKPTAVAFGQRDVQQKKGSLPISEQIHDITIAIPWFKKYDKPTIQRYAEAFIKVIEHFYI
jgi:dTDP-4-amino-4,6-dideoxygalactose transaminase